MKKISCLFVTLIMSMSFFIISCNNKDDKGKDAKISSRIIKFSTLGTNFTKELNEKLFKAVMEGKIKAYRYDSLTPGCMFQKDEIAKISTIEESVQYAPDSTHPDFLVDTVIKQVFDPSGITGYSVAEKWSLETEENSMEADIFAFALNWQPTIAGIALRESPLFWVDYKEVQKLLSKGQVEELNKTIYNSLIEKLSE